jgi:hypothetical protein
VHFRAAEDCPGPGDAPRLCALAPDIRESPNRGEDAKATRTFE